MTELQHDQPQHWCGLVAATMELLLIWFMWCLQAAENKLTYAKKMFQSAAAEQAKACKKANEKQTVIGAYC